MKCCTFANLFPDDVCSDNETFCTQKTGINMLNINIKMLNITQNATLMDMQMEGRNYDVTERYYRIKEFSACYIKDESTKI